MSRLATAAKALHDYHRYGAGQGWDAEPSQRGYFMNDARVVLMADGDFGRCRVCDAPTRLITNLGTEVPLANWFTEDAPRFPLRVEACDGCVLLQLEEAVDPALMFSDYPYLSSMSATFVAHAKALVEAQDVKPTDLVVEIGSNDGYLLRHYGCRVLGVDPSNVEADVPTMRVFFNEKVAETIRAQHGPSKVIHANNVIAHCPDPHTVMAGIKTLLDVDGVAYIETPHVDGLAWDTIYHEHVFYWSATAMVRLAEKHGLVVADVERLDLHGGSLRFHLRHRAVPSERVLDIIGTESGIRWTLDRQIYLDVDRIRRTVQTYRDQGLRVCGYGAAAKGAVLVNVCGLALDFVCDTTPTKQGKTMPGTRIPIVGPERLADADVAVLLAWNFADEILARESWWTGKWLMPHA